MRALERATSGDGSFTIIYFKLLIWPIAALCVYQDDDDGDD